MRTRAHFALITTCLLLAGSIRVSAQSPADARKSYDAAVQEAKRAFMKSDADALAAVVTEDYTGIGASGDATKGRSGELKEQRAFCAANTVTAWDATTTAFRSSGTVAWAAGTMRMTYRAKATGKTAAYEGHFLATYAQQPDKRWLQQYFMTVPMAAAKK